MRKYVIIVSLTSCGPIYLPMGFILPPSGVFHETDHVAGGMCFLGGGYNSGDRAWGMVVYYRRVIPGKFYKLSMGAGAYGGEYHALDHDRGYFFSGVHADMEPDLRIRIFPRFSISTGMYGGLGAEEGSYVNSLVSNVKGAVPVFRVAYTLGMEAGSRSRIMAKLYLGLPTALMFGFSREDRWSIYGGISHSDSGTAFIGLSFGFR